MRDPRSIRLGTRELHRLSPLFGFFGDELPEIGGRAGAWQTCRRPQKSLRSALIETIISSLPAAASHSDCRHRSHPDCRATGDGRTRGIEKATEQFKAPATKLMARPISDSCSPRGEPSRNTEAGILLTEHVTEDAPRSSPMLAGLAPTGSRVLVGAPVQRTKGTRCLIPGLAHMPMEFLHGRPLSPEDLERIRQEIEAFDNIDVIDDEIRGIVARNWPHLLSKLPPEGD